MRKGILKKESIRIGSTVADIKQSFNDNLAYIQGKFPSVATLNDYYMSLAYTVRDRLMAYWTKTARTYLEKGSRTVCYLSAEYLLGPQLGNNMLSLGIYDNVKKAMQEMGLNFEELLEKELEPGLGNGGLGRLAACFMDSLATLNLPAIGYGIRYEFGIFEQEIREGWQIERTDKWLRFGNPWEIPRPEIAFDVKFGGRTEHSVGAKGSNQVKWIPGAVVKGVAYDMPIIGYDAKAANFIRLWKAEACESFDFQAFNIGDYWKAVNEKVASENITKVLYPNDEPLVGRKLRLQQQYFFVSSTLQDMIRIFQQKKKSLAALDEKYVVQLNDTHPSIAIAEMMRLLVDEHQMDWERAWDTTNKMFCYTNHTVMSEALEKWPLDLFAEILPRHLEIIYEINRRFLDKVKVHFKNDVEKMRSLSLIDETGERNVRMTNLACVGSKSINGVSELHTELLKKDVLHDFYEMMPEKFINVTNGITQRRFLLLINPRLSNLITKTIGDTWIKDLNHLRKLENHVDDKNFQKEWQKVKQSNKKDLAELIHKNLSVDINSGSIFDVQAKRFHAYKRQHLNVLHIITLYNRIKHNPDIAIMPRTFLFAGKAAPGYFMAKLVIKLINSVADVVNKDPDVKGRIKVVFLPNFNVKNAHLLYPASDISEQISCAGKEASGTGNMKFSLNGALTIGTYDGANIEMREEFGADNFFLFGLTAEEVAKRKQHGYKPSEIINSDKELSEVIELIRYGYFSKNDVNLFHPFIENFINYDEYLALADYRQYIEKQEEVSKAYSEQSRWTKMSILNVARIGKFSSDRAIKEYAQKIWQIKPVRIKD